MLSLYDTCVTVRLRALCSRVARTDAAIAPIEREGTCRPRFHGVRYA